MRCGTKCFIVTIEMGQQTFVEEVGARSQTEARKMTRRHYGNEAKVKRIIKKDGLMK
ncbi:hypothetical protein GCM10022378_16450 [Salinicoccus jeotgali]|uniref:Uncharacterized protein n=1 Tax=Salinicoccus jeotgali TaxID=381634 RepID=A0ABP7EZJ3_9STAP